LNFHLFAQNNREVPNIRRFTDNGKFLSCFDQFVSFSFAANDTFHIAIIYASTSYIKRRSLWHDLSILMSSNPGRPWSFIGDFNVVLGNHEHRGSNFVARLPVKEFGAWIDGNHLHYFPTIGSLYTWTSGRLGSARIDKRLDGACCNSDWIASWNSISCHTITKYFSDHFPVLFQSESTERNPLPFNVRSMWLQRPYCEKLVSDAWNISWFGCHIYVLNQKLKKVNRKLIYWIRNVFGNVNGTVTNATNNLARFQANLDSHAENDDLILQKL